ncbi:MAG: hypothetical protein NTX53_02710 [candidate division WOR-3 bacterium]|nr:hypothetical protein [candidate division WOR-3 bacterium]
MANPEPRAVVTETPRMASVLDNPKPGKHKRIAVKVIDFRGNEVMRVVSIGAGVSAQKAR